MRHFLPGKLQQVCDRGESIHEWYSNEATFEVTMKSFYRLWAVNKMRLAEQSPFPTSPAMIDRSLNSHLSCPPSHGRLYV